jgi:predicted SAM-dependent methyltransferase
MPLQLISRITRRAAVFGFSRYCPVCRSPVRRFLPHGLNPRPDARCPICGALERHRLLWLFLRPRLRFRDGRPRRMLHVAPEAPVALRVARNRHLRYISADLHKPDVMLRMDATAIPLPDQSVDLIQCSHVLEHVPEDRQAMREFRRVLRPDGWAVFQVPVTAALTEEDRSVTDPLERLRLYGQHDHVRRYGWDFVDRLRESGFRVDVVHAEDLVPPRRVRRMGLPPREPLFVCVRDEGRAGE